MPLVGDPGFTNDFKYKVKISKVCPIDLVLACKAHSRVGRISGPSVCRDLQASDVLKGPENDSRRNKEKILKIKSRIPYQMSKFSQILRILNVQFRLESRGR